MLQSCYNSPAFVRSENICALVLWNLGQIKKNGTWLVTDVMRWHRCNKIHYLIEQITFD